MGRPLKSNNDYFRHDADMRNDIYVRALRLKYGHEGYAVWCYMLEVLTDKDGFEFELTDLTVELLAVDFYVASIVLREILDYCCKLGLLQRNGNMIYSDAHKKRMEQQARHRLYQRERKAIVSSQREEEEIVDSYNGVLDSNNEVLDSNNRVLECKRGKKKETKITEKSSPRTPLEKNTEKDPLNPPKGTEEEIFSQQKTEAMKEEEIKDVMRKRYEALDAPGRKQYQMLNERLDEMGCKLREKFYLMSWGEWGKIGAGIWKVLANIPSSVKDKPAYMMTCMRNSINGRK